MLRDPISQLRVLTHPSKLFKRLVKMQFGGSYFRTIADKALTGTSKQQLGHRRQASVAESPGPTGGHKKEEEEEEGARTGSPAVAAAASSDLPYPRAGGGGWLDRLVENR